MTKFLIQFSLIFCISILADDHIDANAKFSECQGKVANYYLSNLVDGGSVEGWLKAAAMLLISPNVWNLERSMASS